jgi:hypothetical protein
MKVIERDRAVELLTQSLKAMEWAVSQTSQRWHHPPPGAIPGDEWGVAMSLAHLAVFEEYVAVPALEAVAGGGDGAEGLPQGRQDWLGHTDVALSVQPIEAILDRLRAARQRTLEAIQLTSDDRFALPLLPHWPDAGPEGLKSSAWVAAYTLQHSWEHSAAIAGIAVFAPP